MMAVAWIAVATSDGKYAVAVVLEDSPGYAVDDTKFTETWEQASSIACADNAAADISPEEVHRVVRSSINASNMAGVAWGPRKEC